MLEFLDRSLGTTATDLSWTQMTFRALVVFVFGLALMRLGGWRAFNKLSPPDILITIIVGSNLSRAVTGNSPLLPTFAGSATLVLLYWLVTRLASTSSALDRVMKGKRVCLAHDGVLDWRAMRRSGISRRDLECALRENGLSKIPYSGCVYLERDGEISVLDADQERGLGDIRAD